MPNAFTDKCELVPGEWHIVCPSTQVKLAPIMFYAVLALFIMMILINYKVTDY